jgi:hypothetical protein
MAFFPPNHGDSKMYYTSRKTKNKPPIHRLDEEEDTSLTWHDTPQDLYDIHEAERIKDETRHANYLKREKVIENKMKLKDQYMKENIENLLRPYVEPKLNVPRQPQSWMNIDTSYKPGIGLLGKGEETGYDVYDTDFHGGKKRKTRKTKSSKKTKKAKRTRKSKKPRKTRKSRR